MTLCFAVRRLAWDSESWCIGDGPRDGTDGLGARLPGCHLLRQDPTQTIEAYAGIVKVLLGGRVLDPADLVADRSH
jgi:hypothetical protein